MGSGGAGGAGGEIAFDSCYFSDWRGLAGKGTRYKGCAQQGWSVRLRVRVCAMPQLPASHWHFQCHELAGLGVQGPRGFFGASQAPVLICLPGYPCTLAHICASHSIVRPCPAWLQWSLLTASPGLSPLVPQVCNWGGTLHHSPAPVAGAHTRFCKVLLRLQGLEHAKTHTRTKVKWPSAVWQLQPSWCPSGASTPGESLSLLSRGIGRAEPGRERRKGA